MATHFHALQITDIRPETPECISIAFQVPDALIQEYQFTQGQNVTLRTTLEGEELRRSYSICSSPADHELRVAVKKAEFGKFSTWANNTLKKGDLLDVLPPTGTFYTDLNPAHKKNYIAFVAGSGITPVISIIKTTLAIEPGSSFTLVYGNRNRANIIFKEQLEALKNRYMHRFSLHHILSREKTEAGIYHGRINTEKCKALGEKLINIHDAGDIFLCGPEAMIFDIKNWLEQEGIDKKKIHFELFSTPEQKFRTGNQPSAVKTGAGGKVSRITVRLDGVSFDFDLAFNGEPVLDAALKQGADLPYACKGGVCSTCKARLLEGKVDMDTNYALEEDEVNAGYILTCQSHPRSEKIMVDFDIK